MFEKGAWRAEDQVEKADQVGFSIPAHFDGLPRWRQCELAGERAEIVEATREHEALIKGTENLADPRDRWNRWSEYLGRAGDALGLGIEPGIMETVVALNVVGVYTTGSCEGHLIPEDYIEGEISNEDERGLALPWVSFAPPEEPFFRFREEVALYEKIAQQENIPIAELVRDDRATKLQTEWIETEAYQVWDRRKRELDYKVYDLLDDFYGDTRKRRLGLDPIVGSTFLRAGFADILGSAEVRAWCLRWKLATEEQCKRMGEMARAVDRRMPELSSGDRDRCEDERWSIIRTIMRVNSKKEVANRDIRRAQREMQAFTGFLKLGIFGSAGISQS